MLAPEHVRAKRRGETLSVPALTKAERERALELAEQLLSITAQSLGLVREEVEEAWGSVVPEPRDRKLCDGLCKLVEDACEFGAELDIEPKDLRKSLFVAAGSVRKSLESGAAFPREAVPAEVAAQHGVSVEGLERGLYADL